MNVQAENGIEWTHYFGPGSGRTWNVSQGCKHDCKWVMPDGAVAQCYAKSVAERFQSKTFFPQGFDHYYWHPHKIDEPLKEKRPCGIFLDSMSDLMGHWVPDDHIHQVLDVCAQASWHVFFLLTKNAPRLKRFEFPGNVFVGVSAPPSMMMGKPLSDEQRDRMVKTQLDILTGVKARVRWMSIEPLSFDIAPLLTHPLPLEWAVIGAASNGPKVYQPRTEWVRNTLTALDGIPVFFKGNLMGNPAAAPWRQEFPVIAPQASIDAPVQKSLF